MPVVQYKLVKTEIGAMQAPPYIKDGGHWYSPKDNTMIGWYDHSTEYEKPSNLREMSKSEFRKRILQSHSENPFTERGEGSPNEDSTEMTTEQVIQMADDWYEDFFTKNNVIPANHESEAAILNAQMFKIAEAFLYMESMVSEATVMIPIASEDLSCPFGCDEVTQKNIIGINTAIASDIPIPNPTYWTPKGYPFPIEVSHMELKMIGGAILDKQNEYYGVYFYHKANIMMSSDYNTIMRYDYTTGYPE